MPELIDRHAMLKKVYEHPQEREGMTDGEWCRKCNYEAPKVEAEPVRHGRWKKKNGEIYCTNCKKSKWSKSFELMLRGFDFCPKCGADMREEGADNG